VVLLIGQCLAPPSPEAQDLRDATPFFFFSCDPQSPPIIRQREAIWHKHKWVHFT